MAEYIDSLEEFKHAEEICRKLIKMDATLPVNVFRPEFDVYLFSEFDRLFLPKAPLWNHILSLARKLSDGTIYLYVLDPTRAMCSACGIKYGVVAIDPKDQADDIFDIVCLTMKEGPDGVFGEGLELVANRFVIFPESEPYWCLWADRWYEVAIMAVNDSSAWRAAEKTWRNDWYKAEQAIDELLTLAFFPDPYIPEDFRWEFLANY